MFANTGNDQVDILRGELMLIAEMRANLVDQLSDVMVDTAALSAHQVELIVGMGDLPPCRIVDAQMRLPYQVDILEQGQRSIDRGDVHGWIGLVHSEGDLFSG